MRSKEFKLSEIYEIYQKLIYLSNMKRLGSISYEIRKFARPFREIYQQLEEQRNELIKKYSNNGVFTEDSLTECNNQIVEMMSGKDSVEYGEFNPAWIFSVEVENCSILDQFIEDQENIKQNPTTSRKRK